MSSPAKVMYQGQPRQREPAGGGASRATAAEVAIDTPSGGNSGGEDGGEEDAKGIENFPIAIAAHPRPYLTVRRLTRATRAVAVLACWLAMGVLVLRGDGGTATT